MEEVKIDTDIIKLDSFLKWANLAQQGSDAKMFIKSGEVKVNNEVELRRGRKLKKDDIIEFQGKSYKIV